MGLLREALCVVSLTNVMEFLEEGLLEVLDSLGVGLMDAEGVRLALPCRLHYFKYYYYYPH